MRPTVRLGMLLVAMASVIGTAAGWAGRAEAADTLRGRKLAVVVPFGPGSTVDAVAEFVRAPLARSAGVDVALHYLPIREAMARFRDHPAGEVPLLATNVLFHSIQDLVESPPLRLESLVPLAKLTLGISSTLYVAASSPISGWDDLSAAVQRGGFSVGHRNPADVFLGMLERHLGARTVDRIGERQEALFTLVRGGQVDAGLVDTPSFVARHREEPGTYRAILTFGAARNENLDVPTLAEASGEPKLAGTASIGLFGPPDLPPALAAELTAALLRAAFDPTVVEAAAARYVPWGPTGPDVLKATLDRDRRVAEAGMRISPDR